MDQEGIKPLVNLCPPDEKMKNKGDYKMRYEVVLNETKTRMVKRVVPVNCSPTEIKKEKEDYIEKGKKDEPDQAKRDIQVVKKKTCDLDTEMVDKAEVGSSKSSPLMKAKNTSFQGKGESVPLVQSAEGGQHISVRKDVFDSLMLKAYPEYKDLEETQSAGEYLEKQRERDMALRRKKELNPMLDVEEDFRTMANGVMSEEEIEEAAAKKKKPNCERGNVWHDSEGRLSNKKNAKSFSLQFSKSGGDCVGGVAKMPGQKFTKLPCGRKSKHSGAKAKFKCKDGTPS